MNRTKKIIVSVATFITLVSGSTGIYEFAFNRGAMVDVEYSIYYSGSARNGNGIEIYISGKRMQSDQELRWATVTFINTGTKPIALIDYDELDLPGFTVSGGEIVGKPCLVGASGSYLEKTERVALINNKVLLSKAIFEPDDYVKIHIAVICDRGDPGFVIVPCGKIAGIANIADVTVNQKLHE